jgi:transposase-like protein
MEKRIRTLEQMKPLIKEWQKTGMNKKLFCRTHQINVHTFSYWVDKLEKGSEKVSKETSMQANKSASTLVNGFVRIESGERHKSDNPMSLPSLELQFPKGAILRLSSMISDWELNALKSLLY